MSKPTERHPQFALKPLALAIALAAGAVLPAPRVLAQLPTGGSVAAGNGLVGFASPNANTLNVNQATPKAIIDWQTFNIGAGNTVNFNQPSAAAVALNRINSQSGPSNIAGALNANGRVYLINQNGILFSGTAQVNTAGLVASTLDIDEELFKNSSILTAINNGDPALHKDLAAMSPEDREQYLKSHITIENGAHLKTASGGTIMVFAPTVTNKGTIETPDGQTILAAAQDKVYLTVSDQDDDYRGLLVEVGTGGTVTNAELGKIIAERGNITLLGIAVNQSGRLTATTAVDRNGTIRLLARDGAVTVTAAATGSKNFAERGFDAIAESPTGATYAYATQTGKVTLGGTSTTEILPDANGQTAPKAQLPNPSKIEVMGKTIEMQANSVIKAPNAEVIMTAISDAGSFADKANAPKDDARVYLADGSLIDVSGVDDVVLDMSRNVLEVELRGNELKDSPLQRDGILRNETVKIDLRYGDAIDIADISGALAAVKSDVRERMTAGGQVKLRSTGDVVVSKGATVDVSGGAVHFNAGLIESTKLVDDGAIVDISKADPNRVYEGILGVNTRDHAKWNVKERFIGMNTQTGGVWVDAFTRGDKAGAISIESHELVMEGNILAGVTIGEYQRDIADQATGGELAIRLRRGIDSLQEMRIVDEMIYREVGIDDRLVLDDAVEEDVEDTDLAAEGERLVAMDNDGDGVADLIVHDDMLSQSGLGSIVFDLNGEATIEAGAELQLADGADLSITASGIEHAGSVTTHGGSVSFATQALKNQETTRLDDDGNRIANQFPIHLTEGSLIDVSGVFTNDYALPVGQLAQDAININAGSVSLQARGSLHVDAGAVVRADGGAYIDRERNLDAGDGGNVSLASKVLDGADMILDGSITSYALEKGGKLAISAASVAIGDAPDVSAIDTGDVLQLDNAFFNEGGFSEYEITANLQTMLVDASANVNLQPLNRVFNPDQSFLTASTGTDMLTLTSVQPLPAYLREPGSITLSLAQSESAIVDNSEQLVNGSFAIEDGASIVTGVGGAIKLNSDHSLYIGGHLQADGGTISATIKRHSLNAIKGYDPTQSLWLGSRAELVSNAAFVEAVPDADGLRTGHMVDAGNISLTAQRGFIVAEEGSRIEASGMAAQVDAEITLDSQIAVITQTMAGTAGSVDLTAAEGLLLDGDIVTKRADIAGAQGGNLSVTLDSSQRYGSSAINLFPQGSPVIRLDGDRGNVAEGLTFGDELDADQIGLAVLDSSALNAMDLDTLTLKARHRELEGENFVTSRVEFEDGASLHALQQIGIYSTNLRVNDDSLAKIDSAAVVLGDSTYSGPKFQVTDAVTSGNGAMVISADFIELNGNVGVDHIAELSLASRGDIRLNSAPGTTVDYAQSSLQAAADINLLAQQIYPSSLADYRIVSTAEEGRIRVVRADGNAEVPLSAAGKLTLLASEIEQAGVLRAPLGEIVLGNADTRSVTLAAGSLTSVSAEGKKIPLGRIQGEDIIWNYQIGSANPMIIDNLSLPDKNIAVNGESIAVESDAVVDISGGGDIYATEFITGPGGSKDVLQGVSASDSFAIVPSMRSGYAPYDAMESAGSGIALGSTLHIENDVTLANGQRLAAGEYTILPARYALQDGAVLVTPIDTKATIIPAQGITRVDGMPVVAGKRGYANTAVEDSIWSSFVFEPGTVALNRSEYVKKTATDFFTGERALHGMPGDAGLLALIAGTELDLDATLVATHAEGGRGSRVDIAADNLLITQNGLDEAPQDTVVLNADDINALGADSVLLGGVRSRLPLSGDDESDEPTVVTGIDVSASRVDIADGVALIGSEFVLAATDAVTVGKGARIAAETDSVNDATVNDTKVDEIHIEGDGALLQVSALQRALVSRTNETGTAGDLELADDAQLIASRSLVLDASHDMTVDNVVLDSDAVTLSSRRLVLGDVAVEQSVDGTLLGAQLLAQLQPQALLLRSRSDIEIVSDVTVQAADLSLQASRIVSAEGTTAVFQADGTLQLEGNAPATADASAHGSLTLRGSNVRLGSNADTATPQAMLTLDAADVAINATKGVELDGALALHSAGNLDITTPAVTAISAADTSIAAEGVLNLRAGEGTADPAQLASSVLGADLQLLADAITLDTHIRLPSGAIEAIARQGNLVVGAKAQLDAAGIKQTFATETVASAGGNVVLSATGDVSTLAGSLINVSGAALDQTAGSGAGELAIKAAGQLLMAGEILGVAVDPAAGGEISLDALSFANFDEVLTKIAQGKFSGAVDLRQRRDNLVLAQTQSITAHDIRLAVDAGSANIAGTLNASGNEGGSIAIAASGDAVVSSTARLDAHAQADDGQGGRVAVASTDGNLELQQGAVIDVSGGDNSATGKVHLRARRDAATHHVAVTALDATVIGASRIELEAFDDSIVADVINNDVMSAALANINAFMAQVSAQLASMGALAQASNFHLLPGIEIVSEGDMTVSDEVDLSSWRFTVGDDSVPGVLTLRAGGNLTVNQSISDGFVEDTIDDELELIGYYWSLEKILSSDYSWHINLTAGSDTAAGFRDVTIQGSGDFTLADNTMIRTGTGDIRVAAGNDIKFDGNTSRIYTAGRSPYYQYLTPQYYIDGGFFVDTSFDMPYIGYLHPYVLNGENDIGTLPGRIAFPDSGGDVYLAAGNDIAMQRNTQLVDWLQRFSGTFQSSLDGTRSYLNTQGVVAADFLQGVAALGGGDITINAGGDITNMSVSIPVTVRQNLIADLNNSENPLPITGEIFAQDNTYLWERNGGGDVTVNAGGDILSAQVMADKGDISLHAGGRIGALGDGNEILISMADTHVSLSARRDIGIDAIFNTTMVPQSALQFAGASTPNAVDLNVYTSALSIAFTYGEDAGFDARSTAGDIVFRNNPDTTFYLSSGVNYSSNGSTSKPLLEIMPSTVSATALSGDIYIDNKMTLFPSQTSQLELLAYGNVLNAISGTDASYVGMPDVDPADLPTFSDPLRAADTGVVYVVNTLVSPNAKNFYKDYFGYDQKNENPLQHAETPVHAGDREAAKIIAATGDVDGQSSLTIRTSKSLHVLAGGDIRETKFDIQHANASDVSILQAGDDIDFGFTVNRATGSLVANQNFARIAGPGALDVIAGGDINLGSSRGIESIGDQNNPALPDTGADITLLAGIDSAPAFAAVAERYLAHVAAGTAGRRLVDIAKEDADALKNLFADPASYGVELDTTINAASAEEALQAYNGLGVEDQLQIALALVDIDDHDYTTDLLAFVLSDKFGGDALALASEFSGRELQTRADLLQLFHEQDLSHNNALALAMFGGLDPANTFAAANQHSLLFDVVYAEVRKGGVEELTIAIEDAATQGYQRGYNAIEALFPTIDQNDPDLAASKGNINMVFSNVATRDGGDINFMTPKGGVDVGLAGAFAGFTKTSAELGLIAQSVGSIRGITYGDVNINASRAFALDGGDILMWSSQNDIDAGKGAKTALTIPAPKTVFDGEGNPSIEFPAAVNGSGIQAAVYTADREPGNVYLFAPAGVIDAGDAGISTAGDLFLAATEILGADNINFGGVAIGVPITTSIASSLTGVSDSASAATAGATEGASDGAADNCKDNDCEENNSVAFVTVEIIGLGD